MDLGLRGRTALITGATQGVGRATANCLAGEGCNLILVARTASDLARVREELITATGVEVATVAADLTKAEDRASLPTLHPGVDIVICNTGNTPSDRWPRSTRRAGARAGNSNSTATWR